MSIQERNEVINRLEREEARLRADVYRITISHYKYQYTNQDRQRARKRLQDVSDKINHHYKVLEGLGAV